MPENQLTRGANHGWWLGTVFIALAVSFICDWWGDRKVIREHPVVEEMFYSTHPVREPFVKAETATAGFEYACNSCHGLMKPPQEPSRPLMAEHEEIVLRHESGMTCYTCHNREDRNVLNDIYGRLVNFEQSENVCRRCHGPRFRDWKRGIHGRPSGHWDEAKGASVNVTCVYCHNPHVPHFDPMRPSPPPSRDDFMKKDSHTGTQP